MTLKARYIALLKKHSGESEQPIASEPAQPAPTEKLIETNSAVSTEKLPVYKATLAEINYWHASGCNVFLQSLLREYNLDISNPAAFNHFKIGLDEKRHVATFAIDATNYYAIPFNENNCAPFDKAQARDVLEKISAIRIATRRFKNFCGVEIEYFD